MSHMTYEKLTNIWLEITEIVKLFFDTNGFRIIVHSNDSRMLNKNLVTRYFFSHSQTYIVSILRITIRIQFL